MARQPRPPGGGGRRSLGEKGLLPTGPTAPTRGGRATPQGVFKPPRRDALGTWTGCGGQARRGGDGTTGRHRLDADPGHGQPRRARTPALPARDGARPAGRHHRTPPPPDATLLRFPSPQKPPGRTGPLSLPRHTRPPTPSPSLPAPANQAPLATEGEGAAAGSGAQAGRARERWSGGGGRRGAGPGPEAWGGGPEGRERHGVGGQGRHGRPTDRGGTAQGWRREAADGRHPT